MTQLQEENQVKTTPKVLATFEIDPKKLAKLRKLALEHERSYAFILRKLVDQAVEKGDFIFSETKKVTSGNSPR